MTDTDINGQGKRERERGWKCWYLFQKKEEKRWNKVMIVRNIHDETRDQNKRK